MVLFLRKDREIFDWFINAPLICGQWFLQVRTYIRDLHLYRANNRHFFWYLLVAKLYENCISSEIYRRRSVNLCSSQQTLISSKSAIKALGKGDIRTTSICLCLMLHVLLIFFLGFYCWIWTGKFWPSFSFFTQSSD